MDPKIRIIKRPEGEAPEAVRDAWIGVEIPCIYCFSRPTPDVLVVGAVTGAKRDFCPSYAVFQIVALTLLGEVRPDAQKWWSDHGYPDREEGLFYFNVECAVPIGHIPTRDELLSVINN